MKSRIEIAPQASKIVAKPVPKPSQNFLVTVENNGDERRCHPAVLIRRFDQERKSHKEFWRGDIANVITAILPSLVFGALALRCVAVRVAAPVRDQDR